MVNVVNGQQFNKGHAKSRPNDQRKCGESSMYGRPTFKAAARSFTLIAKGQESAGYEVSERQVKCQGGDMTKWTMARDSPSLRFTDVPQGWYNGGEIEGGRQPRYNGQPANKPLTGGHPMAIGKQTTEVTAKDLHAPTTGAPTNTPATTEVIDRTGIPTIDLSAIKFAQPKTAKGKSTRPFCDHVYRDGSKCKLRVTDGGDGKCVNHVPAETRITEQEAATISVWLEGLSAADRLVAYVRAAGWFAAKEQAKELKTAKQ